MEILIQKLISKQKIDEESADFISIFFKIYKEKVKELSSHEKISIVESFQKLTPYKLIINSLHTLPSGGDKGKKDSFLNMVIDNIGIDLINDIIKCSKKFGQDKIYSSCIIYTFVNNKDLKKLSNSLGILIPNKPLLDDNRTKKELLEKLKDKYKGIEGFSRDFLLLLINDEVDKDKESKVIKNFIKYSKKFDDIDDYTLETSNIYMKALFPNINTPEINQFRINKIL